MCKGLGHCMVLDEQEWDPHCPLRHPGSFSQHFEEFFKALDLLPDIAETNSAIDRLQNDEMTEWYCLHANNLCYYRIDKSVVPPPSLPKSEQDKKRKSSITEERALLDRDFHRCRYCGIQVIHKEVFSRLSDYLGRDDFDWGKTKPKEPGIKHGTRIELLHSIFLINVAQFDHVEPLSRGGRTDLDNLVTSCHGCNQAKYNLTVEQMRMSDPRERQPKAMTGWSGLSLAMIEERLEAI